MGFFPYLATEKGILEHLKKVFMNDTDKDKLIDKTNRKGGVYCITISSNQPEQWEKLICIAKTFYPFWAYIYHDQDKDASGAFIAKHLHLVCSDRKCPSFKMHSSYFEGVIPSYMIEKVKSSRAILRYLTHEDFPEKYHYTKDLVETNNRDKYLTEISNSYGSLADYNDYQLVRSGKMTVKEYVLAHQGQLYNLSLYQKINLFVNLDRVANMDNIKPIIGDK